MFLLGCQGDVNHVNVAPTKGEVAISVIDFDGVPRSNAHAKHMGRIIAGAALSVYSITEEVKTDKISYVFDKVVLPSENYLSGSNIRLKFDYEPKRNDSIPLYIYSDFANFKVTLAFEEGKPLIKKVELE
jgi:hypothetical protein